MSPFVKLTRGNDGYWYRKRFFNLITVYKCTFTKSIDCDIKYLQTYSKFPAEKACLYSLAR